MTIMHSDDYKTPNLSMEALSMLSFSNRLCSRSSAPVSVTSWLCPKNFEDLAVLVVGGQYLPGNHTLPHLNSQAPWTL
jgi:hypothetical protein